MTDTKMRAALLLGAGAVAGGILAGTLSANAATDSSTATSTPAAGSSSAPADRFGSTPVRGDEKALDATLAAALKQKAEQATGGTAYRVETDAGDGTYEAHVRKSDGSLVTVMFDSSGTITATEDGMGKGDPAPAGSPQGSGGSDQNRSGSGGA